MGAIPPLPFTQFLPHQKWGQDSGPREGGEEPHAVTAEGGVRGWAGGWVRGQRSCPAGGGGQV